MQWNILPKAPDISRSYGYVQVPKSPFPIDTDANALVGIRMFANSQFLLLASSKDLHFSCFLKRLVHPRTNSAGWWMSHVFSVTKPEFPTTKCEKNDKSFACLNPSTRRGSLRGPPGG